MQFDLGGYMFYDIEVKKANGEELKMEEYKGKVVLIVNTASKCGFTPQYDGLQKLYEDYGDKGFVILGFPCNQFKNQEPDSAEHVAQQCKINFGVTFPLMEKIEVNGAGEHELYTHLKNEKGGLLGKNIKVHSYNTNITSLKFEIRENASLVPNGTHQLAQGIGFYYKNTNGQVKQVKQGDIVPLEGYTNNNLAYDFYYGEPLVLGTQDQAGVTSRTRVVYSPTHQNYIVMFDSNWKKAEVKVYDMSGKLVISEKNVDASSDYVIKLNDNLKAAYTVKVVSEKGEEVITKILK